MPATQHYTITPLAITKLYYKTRVQFKSSGLMAYHCYRQNIVDLKNYNITKSKCG